MQSEATQLIQSLPSENQFASRLLNWLLADLNPPESDARFTESRAKAVLKAANLLDEPTEHRFSQLMSNPAWVRVALYDLLAETGLSQETAVEGLVRMGDAAASPIEWHALIIAAFAWKRDYPLEQLDPSSPPLPDSPAGQILSRAVALMRQQLQRGATERDKLSQKLTHRAGGPPSLDRLPAADQTIAPVPPYFRSPVPVRYPEMARETLHITPDEPLTTVQRGTPLTILPEDVAPAAPQPTRLPAINISNEPLPSPLPPSAVVMPNSAVEPKPGLTVGFRNMFRNEPMKTTKLRVIVQEYPDGPGLYGLQVRVSCATIRSYVAGTTDRSGHLLCELPVRLNSGLTYDVDVTWPREHSGEIERKSITLNADRTEFTLPFYRRLKTPSDPL